MLKNPDHESSFEPVPPQSRRKLLFQPEVIPSARTSDWAPAGKPMDRRDTLHETRAFPSFYMLPYGELYHRCGKPVNFIFKEQYLQRGCVPCLCLKYLCENRRVNVLNSKYVGVSCKKRNKASPGKSAGGLSKKIHSHVCSCNHELEGVPAHVPDKNDPEVKHRKETVWSVCSSLSSVGFSDGGEVEQGKRRKAHLGTLT